MRGRDRQPLGCATVTLQTDHPKDQRGFSGTAEPIEGSTAYMNGWGKPRASILSRRHSRCGCLRTTRLVPEHGTGVPVPELRHVVAADCPRMVAGRLRDVYEVHSWGLAWENTETPSAVDSR